MMPLSRPLTRHAARSLSQSAAPDQTPWDQNISALDSHPASEKLLSVLRPATGHVANALGLREGENTIHLRTLRRIAGLGLCLTDHYFADLSLWPALQHFERGSPLEFLETQLNTRLVRSHTRIGTRRARAKESVLLEVPLMTPLLCVRILKRHPHSQQAAGYSVSLIRADMIEFTLEH